MTPVTSNTELLDRVQSGQLDNFVRILSGMTNEDLQDLRDCAAERVQAIGSIRELSPGSEVVITSTRPRYLVGARVTVVRANERTVTVQFPTNPRYRRYSGASGVRVPIACVAAA